MNVSHEGWGISGRKGKCNRHFAILMKRKYQAFVCRLCICACGQPGGSHCVPIAQLGIAKGNGNAWNANLQSLGIPLRRAEKNIFCGAVYCRSLGTQIRKTLLTQIATAVFGAE